MEPLRGQSLYDSKGTVPLNMVNSIENNQILFYIFLD